jgi:hypothetical protein
VTVRTFPDDAHRWKAVAAGRAPAYHRLLDELVGLIETQPAVVAHFDRAWAGRSFRIYYERPLLVLASLRRDALAEGEDHPLWAAMVASDPGAVTRPALVRALERATFWDSIARRFVQTNETSRAVAWLWPAEILGVPLALFEVGTAAGLNLVADALEKPWTRTSGGALLGDSSPRVLSRTGLDAHPLDPRRDDDATWLRACVWAGESERLARLERAIEAFRANPAILEAGDVTDVPSRLRAIAAPGGAVVLAFQTIVRDYLDAGVRSVYEDGMRAWLHDTPRALWVELELGADQNVPIVAHTRSGDATLGITSYHPASIAVDVHGVARLRTMF